MRQFSFRLPRAYRLKPFAQREDDALSLLSIGTSSQSVVVPYSQSLDYVVVPSQGGALAISGDDFRVETLGACHPYGRGCAWRSSSRKRNI